MADEFHKTRMGARFFEATAPAAVEQLKRIADQLEALNAAGQAGATMHSNVEVLRVATCTCATRRCRATKARS